MNVNLFFKVGHQLTLMHLQLLRWKKSHIIWYWSLQTANQRARIPNLHKILNLYESAIKVWRILMCQMLCTSIWTLKQSVIFDEVWSSQIWEKWRLPLTSLRALVIFVVQLFLHKYLESLCFPNKCYQICECMLWPRSSFRDSHTCSKIDLVIFWNV